MDAAQVGDVPESTPFNEIVVTTIDTIRYSYLLNLLATHGRHVLFTGATGTGKTVYIKAAIEALDKSVYQNIQTAFSAQTNANMVQDIIDMKLDKRRKGIFGPPFGMKCVIFVDDLNMPALEVYGAQPPIELLRQFMDHEGWYDRSDNTFRTLADIQLIAAMGPPGGGRNSVTPRFLRHFNLVSITEFDDATYTRIYTAIMDWWGRRARLPDEVRGKAGAVVKATIEVYNTIRKELLPTPAKSHYTYNMRDLGKVFQASGCRSWAECAPAAAGPPHQLLQLGPAFTRLHSAHDNISCPAPPMLPPPGRAKRVGARQQHRRPGAPVGARGHARLPRQASQRGRQGVVLRRAAQGGERALAPGALCPGLWRPGGRAASGEQPVGCASCLLPQGHSS